MTELLYRDKFFFSIAGKKKLQGKFFRPGSGVCQHQSFFILPTGIICTSVKRLCKPFFAEKRFAKPFYRKFGKRRLWRWKEYFNKYRGYAVAWFL